MGEVLRFERNTSNVVLNNTSIGVEFKRASFGGGGGGPMEPTVSMREYVDKADEAVESRLGAKLDKLPTAGHLWGIVAAVIGGVATVLTIFLGVLAFGGDRFDGGVNVGPQIEAVRKEQANTDATQNAKASLMDDKLDLIIQQTSKK